MTSLIFGCVEKFLTYTVFLPSFIVVRHQMAELTWGAFLPLTPSNIGCARTPSKIGLKNDERTVLLPMLEAELRDSSSISIDQ